MLSALMMLRRMATALRVALREEEFVQILGAALALVAVGTPRTRSPRAGASWMASTWPSPR
jgi:hypothetical protein